MHHYDGARPLAPAGAVFRRALRDSRTRTLSFALLFAFAAAAQGDELPQRVSDARRPRRARAHVRRQPGHAPALRHAARPAHHGRLAVVAARLAAGVRGAVGAVRRPSARSARRRSPGARSSCWPASPGAAPRSWPRWAPSAPGPGPVARALRGAAPGRARRRRAARPTWRSPCSRPRGVRRRRGAREPARADAARGARPRRRRARRGAGCCAWSADTSAPLDWLRWATPLGWAEELRPVRRRAAARARAARARHRAAARRVVADRRAARHRRRPAAGARQRAAAQRRALVARGAGGARAARRAVAWLAGTGLVALLLGALADSVSGGISGDLDAQFRKLGTSLEQAKGFLGLEFLFLVLAVCLFVCFQIAAAREEEAEQRLETLLALPVGRRRWLAGRLAVAALGAAAIALVAGLLAWAGAACGGRRGVARRAARGGRELPARRAALPRARGAALRARPARERRARVRARRR